MASPSRASERAVLSWTGRPAGEGKQRAPSPGALAELSSRSRCSWRPVETLAVAGRGLGAPRWNGGCGRRVKGGRVTGAVRQSGPGGEGQAARAARSAERGHGSWHAARSLRGEGERGGRESERENEQQRSARAYGTASHRWARGVGEGFVRGCFSLSPPLFLRGPGSPERGTAQYATRGRSAARWVFSVPGRANPAQWRSGAD